MRLLSFCCALIVCPRIDSASLTCPLFCDFPSARQELTGDTWANKFKKQYGSIKQFVQKYAGEFSIDEKDKVTLLTARPNNIGNAPAQPAKAAPAAAAPKAAAAAPKAAAAAPAAQAASTASKGEQSAKKPTAPPASQANAPKSTQGSTFKCSCVHVCNFSWRTCCAYSPFSVLDLWVV